MTFLLDWQKIILSNNSFFVIYHQEQHAIYLTAFLPEIILTATQINVDMHFFIDLLHQRGHITIKGFELSPHPGNYHHFMRNIFCYSGSAFEIASDKHI